jgi:hypothetical protein
MLSVLKYISLCRLQPRKVTRGETTSTCFCCVYYSLTNNLIKATEGERTPFFHLKMTHRLSSTLNDRPFPDESQVELHNNIKSSNITQQPQETRKFRLIFLPFVGNIQKFIYQCHLILAVLCPTFTFSYCHCNSNLYYSNN